MEHSFQLKTVVNIILGVFFLASGQVVAGEPLPIIDAHIHYSHDAWQRIPPEAALKKLREAGLRRAFVSSSSDEGTQRLYRLAPDFIVPVLRPYRKRGEITSWMRDESVIPMLEELLEKNHYAGIGEFHAYGDDIELPVLRAVIALAQRHNLFLHAHVDADAIERIFKRNADARVLWAHAGFEPPAIIAQLLEKYPGLRADLAFRDDHQLDDMVEVKWQALFERFPNRFVLGTDTYTPERWYYLSDQAQTSRRWLRTLDKELAERIAYRNAEQLLLEVKFK